MRWNKSTQKLHGRFGQLVLVGRGAGAVGWQRTMGVALNGKLETLAPPTSSKQLSTQKQHRGAVFILLEYLSCIVSGRICLLAWV